MLVNDASQPLWFSNGGTLFPMSFEAKPYQSFVMSYLRLLKPKESVQVGDLELFAYQTFLPWATTIMWPNTFKSANIIWQKRSLGDPLQQKSNNTDWL